MLVSVAEVVGWRVAVARATLFDVVLVSEVFLAEGELDKSWPEVDEVGLDAIALDAEAAAVAHCSLASSLALVMPPSLGQLS